MMLQPNTLLFIEGDAGDQMFVIKSGRIRLLKREGSRMLTLAELGPGSVVGEMSLLDQQPRSATAKTLETTEVAIIDQAVLEQAFHSLPSWLVSTIRILVQRLRETTNRRFVQNIDAGLPAFLACLQAGETHTHSPVFLPIDSLTPRMKAICGLEAAETAHLCRICAQLGVGKYTPTTQGPEGFHFENSPLARLLLHFLRRNTRTENTRRFSLTTDEILFLQTALELAQEKSGLVSLPITLFTQTWNQKGNPEFPSTTLHSLIQLGCMDTRPPRSVEEKAPVRIQELIFETQEIQSLLALQNIIPMVTTGLADLVHGAMP